jgi:hypothetical protein
MKTVELSDAEWTQVVGFMSYAPAKDCMPLINKIGQQISQQILVEQKAASNPPNIASIIPSNGKEAHHE